MKNLLIIIGVILCFSPETIAQNNAIFSGGIADGTDTSCYKQAIPTTVSFIGGTDDGYSIGCYTQSIPQSISFMGGSNDGYAQGCFQQLIPLTVSFSGGVNDGYAQGCYTQVSNLNAIFNGGIGGDGMLNGCANEPLGCNLAVNLGNDTSFCAGNSLTLNPGTFSGSATYLWQDSSTTQTFLADTSGTYFVYVTDTGGCTGIDSIIISVLPQPLVNLGNDTSFCDGGTLTLDAGNPGATYLWQNNPTPPYQNQTLTVNATGVYFVTASFGICVDTDSINVTVNPIVTNTLVDSIICQGDSALIFGNYETIDATYYDTLIATTGCDSIVSQHLTVNPTYNSTLSPVTICQGDSALILGLYRSTAGMYSSTYQTINGCDSTISQNLIVSPIHDVDLGNDTSFCIGGILTLYAGAGANSYVWQNNPTPSYQNQTLTVSATGTYFVVTTLGACTTSDTIQVTVNPIVTNVIPNAIICQGDSALIHGNYETVAATYNDTLISATGCDSIVSQTLIVNSVYNTTLSDIAICQGDSALIFGNYENVAGIYVDSSVTVYGCDSIVIQTLILNTAPTVDLGEDTSICQGSSISLDAGPGANYQWFNISGGLLATSQIYSVNSPLTVRVIKSIGSCSATDTITVSINPVVTTNLPSVSICQGDSILLFGNYENTAGMYSTTIIASTGCDSILTQQLILNPTYNIPTSAIICNGDSILLEGSYQTTANVYYDTLATVNGCDSVIQTTLIVNPTYSTNAIASVCNGDSLYLENAYQFIAGTYSDTLNSVNGCDSIILTTLTVNPIAVTNINVAICQGDSLFVGGSYQNSAGTYTDILSTTLGCDSTVYTTITINPIISSTLSPIRICENDSVFIFGNYQNFAGIYDSIIPNGSVNGCDSIVYQQLIINPIYTVTDVATICEGDSIFLGGDYQTTAGAYVDTLQTTIGCDSIITTMLTINPIYTNSLTVEICEGDSIFLSGEYQTMSGAYTDTLQATTSCDSIILTTLIVKPLPIVVITASSTEINAGEEVQLTATGGGTYNWTPSDFLTCSNCSDPTAFPESTTFYTVVVDSNGCSNSDTLTILVNDRFFIPEGFSPNNDNVNDLFEIIGISQYPDMSILIINRWGDKVYEASPYKGDWDGTNQFGLSLGDELPTGTYFYIIDLGKADPDGEQVLKGNIYLNR